MKIKKIRLRKRYKVLLCIVAIISTVITHIYYIEPNQLLINEYKITSKNLPNHFHGTKIIHLTDIHYGTSIKEKQLKRIVNQINVIHPDIVIFTGDLIDKSATLTPEITNTLIKELRRINATLGKYAIYGNQDEVVASYPNILEESNFKLLNNNYELIYKKGYEPIYLGGMNTNKEADFEVLMELFNNNEGSEEDNMPTINYKIMLMHMPDYTDNLLESYNINLVLAGHSHNGQIKLPFIKPIFTPTGAKKYYAPHYNINNTDLYISSGLGTTLFNARFFNFPSFNLYRLTRCK